MTFAFREDPSIPENLRPRRFADRNADRLIREANTPADPLRGLMVIGTMEQVLEDPRTKDVTEVRTVEILGRKTNPRRTYGYRYPDGSVVFLDDEEPHPSASVAKAQIIRRSGRDAAPIRLMGRKVP